MNLRTLPSRLHDSAQPFLRGNRFDRMEWAGAFGDLGTLMPFVVAYLSMLSLDPFGVLFSFGLAMIVCGVIYRTPFPVQPMKAVGAIATTHRSSARLHGRQRKTEHRASPGLARDSHLSAVQGEDTIRDQQAKPAAGSMRHLAQR